MTTALIIEDGLRTLDIMHHGPEFIQSTFAGLLPLSFTDLAIPTGYACPYCLRGPVPYHRGIAPNVAGIFKPGVQRGKVCAVRIEVVLRFQLKACADMKGGERQRNSCV